MYIDISRWHPNCHDHLLVRSSIIIMNAIVIPVIIITTAIVIDNDNTSGFSKRGFSRYGV